MTPKTVACQTPLSMGFSRQEYWSGLPFPPPGALPDSGIEPTSPASFALAGGFFTIVPPGKPIIHDTQVLSLKKFFLAVLDLHCCVQTFSSCVEWWLFSSRSTQALGHGLSTCGARV